MKIPLFIAVLAGWLVHTPLAAAVPRVRTAADEVQLGPDLVVGALGPGFWLHTSKDDRGIPANGLIARVQGGLLLIDTPWTDAQTDRLLDYVAAKIGKVVDAVVTHTHADRMGGIGALRRRHVRARAIDLSVALAARSPLGAPETLFAAADKRYRDPRGFEVFYPGAGHTVDNTVVWFPRAHLLYGGCLVKSEDATDMGYTAEADVTAWPTSIAALKASFPRIDTLVPGHGRVGGIAALDHTLVLLRNAATSASNNRPILADIPAEPDPAARYLFYVHGRILESQGRRAVSPDFGAYAYDDILAALAARGFVVISEVRTSNAGERWVDHLIDQVRRLRGAGVAARNIGLVGASKGGALTLMAAAKLQEPELSYVILAGCGDQTTSLASRLRGRVLSIYDRGDRFKPSCSPTFDHAAGLAKHEEIVVDLGLDHGLIYSPRSEWVTPATEWLRR